MTHRPTSVLLCLMLVVGILLTTTGTGLAISGLASTGSAVGAQYPDAQARPGQDDPAQPDVPPAPTLADLGAAPGAAGAGAGAEGEDVDPQGLVERSLEAVARGAGAGVREYGSIPLLLAGIAVLTAASVIRHRRGVLDQRAAF